MRLHFSCRITTQMDMIKPLFHLIFALLLALSLISCTSSAENEDLTIFTNGSIWDGVSDSLLVDHAVIVQNGEIRDVMALNDPGFPSGGERIDLGGGYLIPGLINAHGHVGVAIGLLGDATAHSTDNVIDQLKLYARYGITSVASMGDEPIHAFIVRDQIDSAQIPMSRLTLAGRVLYAETPEEAETEVAELMALIPDWTKLRVDDGFGRREKMPEEIYTLLISESHSHGVPLAAHIVSLDDAKGVLTAGADLIGHSIRDQAVDQELIDLMLTNDVCLTPTLTRELSTFVYAERPHFFDDPFFHKGVDPSVMEPLLQPEVQNYFRSEEAEFFRNALPLAKENMMALHNAGVTIAMGTDSGPPARFQGYFEHLEMEMMQQAGMSPAEILISATRDAARCVRMETDRGTLEAGKLADFVVLRENPFEDIRNLRSLKGVYIGGKPVANVISE